MNVFQRFGLKAGLIEQVPQDFPSYDREPMESLEDLDSDPIPEAEHVETVSLDSLVHDVYDANNLTDLSRSIFKASDVINTLPSEMATDTKRGAVIGILSSFGLTVDNIVTDGNTRISVLQSNNARIAEVNSAEISEKNITIEGLKHQIEDLSKEIATLEATTEKSNDLISEEIKKIQSLIDFMLGGK